MNTKVAQLAPRGDGDPGSRERVPTIDSQALLGTGRELRIRHQGESYTLRVTRLNKLILTK